MPGVFLTRNKRSKYIIYFLALSVFLLIGIQISLERMDELFGVADFSAIDNLELGKKEDAIESVHIES